MANSFSKLRFEAFRRQAERCHYCTVLMWNGDPRPFATLHRLTPRILRKLRCTAEHLTPRQDGGRDCRENIVAACLRCNSQRHRGWKKALSPNDYARHVRRMMKRGLWHQPLVFERGLVAALNDGSGLRRTEPRHVPASVR